MSALFLSACSERSLESQINNLGTLSGQVSSKTTNLSGDDSYAMTCSSWTAKLYELTGTDAGIKATPLLTTPVGSDGRFKFTALSSVKVKVDTSANMKYVVVIEGCGKAFKRIVTSTTSQDITPSSDLLLRSLTLLSRNGMSVQQVSLSNLSALMEKLDALDLSTLVDVHDALVSDATLKAQFISTYGFDPVELRYLPPDVKLGSIPESAVENSTPTFLITLSHWHPAYAKKALWYDGATYLAEGETAFLPISKNMQGSRSLKVRTGFASGATTIDLTKPYTDVTVPLTVADTFPAVAPTLTRTLPTGTIATTRALTLSLATGASLASCATFTGLALTEEALLPPLSPNDYTITCTSAPTQTFSYTLATSGEGSKTLRLWAMDSSGGISSVASTVVVPLDTITPAAPTLTRISAALSNSTTVQIQNADCNDNATKILFSQTATTPLASDASWQTCVAQNYNVTVSTGDGLKTIYAFLKDDADHISPSSSVTMTLDQTLPTLSLATAPSLGQRLQGGTSFTLSWTSVETNFGTTPVNLELSSDGGSTWVSTATSLAAAGSTSWTIPSYTGSTFKLRVKATDLAGNIGTSAASPAFTIDSTAPNVTLDSLTGGQLLKGGSTALINWTATDSLLATNPISLDWSSDNGATWTPIATALSNSGSYSWTVPSTNGSANRVRVSATDAVGLRGTSTSVSVFTIDSTAPTVTLLSLTGGQTIPGSNAVTTISWTASDARLTSTPITIEYSADSGTTWTAIASALANSGAYPWTVSVADAATYRIRVTAVDQVGNSTSTASTSDFAITSSSPRLTQTTSSLNIVSKTLTAVTYGGACETGLSIVITGTQSTSVACPSGTWTWTTSTSATDAIRTYTFTQTNGIPLSTAIMATWKRDTVAPALSSVMINSGDATTAVPQVRVDITSLETNIEVRLGMADGSGNCQANYVDNNWESHSALTATHLYSMPIGDGIKKICVWTRDVAQNVSVFSPVEGSAGINFDTIDLESGTPPVVTAFSVVNDIAGGTTYTAGQRVKISWTISDAEGLSNDPVTLDYTADAGATWTPIVTNFGSLVGNPTSATQSYLAFNAPSSNVFRIRIRVVDSAGNTASAVISNVQNGNRWGVYAGSNDKGVGGEAKSLRLNMTWSGQFNAYAVNPLNGDIYILTDALTLLRVDRSTGLSSKFVSYNATTNLPDGGAIPTVSTARIAANSRVIFDRNGKLYLLIASSSASGATIWQFDLVQNTVRKYLGGGTVIDGTATSTTAQVANIGISFDDSNTLYYLTYCTPGVLDTTSTVRIMKATQKADGTVGTISIVAGNCVRGNPTSGNIALTEPISSINDNSMYDYGKIAVNGDGSRIYFRSYINPMWKIQGGRIYSSAITSNSTDFQIDSVTNRLYQANGGEVGYWTTTDGANGETFTSLAAKNGTDADCWNDGKPATLACVNANSGAMLGPDRLVYFIDNINGGGYFRIRYIDAAGNIRTAAGGKPVYGEGLSRDLVKVGFGSIYYKQATEPNQAAFPAGLYFASGNAFAVGYLDDDIPLSIIWGSQKAGSATFAPNTTINTRQILSENGFIGTYPMTFDSDGLPWLRLADGLYSVSSSKTILRRSSPNPNYYWDDAVVGGSPKNFGMNAYVGRNNLLIKKNEGIVLMGRSYVPTVGRYDQEPMIRYHDFVNDIVQHVMGGTGTTSTPDSTVAGSLASASISSYCTGSTVSCMTRYQENDPTTNADDVMYFSEGPVLRKLQNPLNPAGNFLSTVFTSTSSIQNFIFSADKKYIYYMRGNYLSCHALNASDDNALCKNTVASHVTLGPPTGMTNFANTFAESMTWRSATRLLISNGQGEIYEFNTAP